MEEVFERDGGPLLPLLENDRSHSNVEILRTIDVRELKGRIEERMKERYSAVKVLPSSS